MDEHLLQNDCDLKLYASTLEGNFNYAPHSAENTLYQHIPKSDHYTYSVPQYTGYQQMAPYFEYLVGNGVSNMQEENTGIGCSFTSDESFTNMNAHQVRNSSRQHEEILLNNFKDTQHQVCYQNQGPQEGVDDNAAIHQSNMSESTKSRRKQKCTETDRRRRTRIATALDSLEDLLAESKEGNRANVVDDCIDYIKYLQLHMKELSQNRLAPSEPTSNQLTYLEGYGHYLVEENMASGPLQDMLGTLFETSPIEATKLLESRGLYMVPNAPN